MQRLKTFLVSILLFFSMATVFAQIESGRGATSPQTHSLDCLQPPYLKWGDKIALISPGYATPMENVEKTVNVLRRWGFNPVVGKNVGKVDAGKYGGTVEERYADLTWALNDPEIKAIICNRGGYGAIHLVDKITPADFTTHAKWLVGFSDITTLHGMESCAGVMSIHGTMSSALAAGGRDATSTLMRDLLMGKVPRYELPPHRSNQLGHASGVLVGGNLCTFTPLAGSWADATACDNFILFIEEVGESMHNIDRLINMLRLQGAFKRCRGVVLGEFLECRSDLSYESVEAMICQYLKPYGIPVVCGFPGGHDKINLPLVMGAPTTIDVRPDGATISFDIKGEQVVVKTASVTTAPVE